MVDFAYDALGRRTRLTLPNGVVTESSYDAASRLTERIYRNAIGILGNLTYQYDAIGNRTQVAGSFARTLLPDPVVHASYDAANRQLQFGNRQMTFDANGNLASITDPGSVTTLSWDARNRLATLTGPSLNVDFEHDSLGRRLTRQVNGTRTDFLYDGVNPVQELSRTSVTANMLSGLGVDEYFTRTDASGTHTLLTDALESTLVLTDNAGTVQSAYTYEPYGRAMTTGTTNANPFQYVGRENDSTGLYYYRARYYLPSTHRFISEDPLGFLGGNLNLYAYVMSNPVNFIDPFGLDSFTVNQGHDYLVVDDPDHPGHFLAFDFYPDPNSDGLDRVFGAVPAIVREQSLTPQKVANFAFMDYGPRGLILTWRNQSSADDRRTIERARELKRLAEERQLKYNAFQARKDTLNCIGFTRAVQ